MGSRPCALACDSGLELCFYAGLLASPFPLGLDQDLGSLQAVVVDCANGVGGPKLRALAERLGARLRLDARNAGRELGFELGFQGGLNERCGAEHVQKERAAPLGCADVRAGARRACALSIARFEVSGVQAAAGGAHRTRRSCLQSAQCCNKAHAPSSTGRSCLRLQGLGFRVRAWAGMRADRVRAPQVRQLDSDADHIVYWAPAPGGD